MYIVMCIHDGQGFKEGLFYDTYQEGANAWMRLEGTKEPFVSMYHKEYLYYFTQIFNFVFLPMYANSFSLSNFVRKFLKKDQKMQIEDYHFELRFDDLTLRKIYSKLLLYLFQVEDKELIAQFSIPIKYSLESIYQMYQIKRDYNLDIDAAISQASILFKEINDYAKSIEQSAENGLLPLKDAKITRFLEAHNELMHQNINMVRYLNGRE